VHLEPIHLADRGEEEQVVVRRRDHEVLDVVVLFQIHSHHALAAAPLLSVRRHRQSLDVAGARDRDDHVLLRDHVLELERVLARHDLRAAVVSASVDGLDLEQLLTDETVDANLVRQDRAELGDALLQVRVFLLNSLSLERRQPLEPQIEDRLRLNL
jgi:hypothetical protein